MTNQTPSQQAEQWMQRGDDAMESKNWELARTCYEKALHFRLEALLDVMHEDEISIDTAPVTEDSPTLIMQIPVLPR